MTGPSIAVFIFLISFVILKYFEENFCLSSLKNGNKVKSFIVGAAIVATFAEIINNSYQEILKVDESLILLVPFALIIFMFIERHIDKHRDIKEKEKELALMIKSFSFFTNFLIGLLIVQNIQNSLSKEILFLGLLLSYHLVNEGSFHLIHEEHKKLDFSQKIKQFILALAVIYGATISYFINIPAILNVGFIAFFTGALIYVFIRAIASQEEKTITSYFLAGALTVASMLMITFLFIH